MTGASSPQASTRSRNSCFVALSPCIASSLWNPEKAPAGKGCDSDSGYHTPHDSFRATPVSARAYADKICRITRYSKLMAKRSSRGCERDPFPVPTLHPAAYNMHQRNGRRRPRLTGRLSVRLARLTVRKFAGGLRACCPSDNTCQRDESCLMTHSSCGYLRAPSAVT